MQVLKVKLRPLSDIKTVLVFFFVLLSDKNPCKLCTFFSGKKRNWNKKMCLAKTGLLCNLKRVFLLLGAGTWIKPVQTRRECPTKHVVDAIFPQCKAQRKNESQLGKFILCCGGGAAPPTVQRSWKTKQNKNKNWWKIFCPFFVFPSKKEKKNGSSYYRLTSLCIYYQMKLTTLFLTLCAPVVWIHTISLALPKPCKSLFCGLKTVAADRSGSPLAVERSGSIA